MGRFSLRVGGLLPLNFLIRLLKPGLLQVLCQLTESVTLPHSSQMARYYLLGGRTALIYLTPLSSTIRLLECLLLPALWGSSARSSLLHCSRLGRFS